MKYYIQRHASGYLGNNLIWWRKGHHGYTDNIKDAHVFDEEDPKFKDITKDNSKYTAWSKDYIDSKTTSCVSSELIDFNKKGMVAEEESKGEEQTPNNQLLNAIKEVKCCCDEAIDHNDGWATFVDSVNRRIKVESFFIDGLKKDHIENDSEDLDYKKMHEISLRDWAEDDSYVEEVCRLNGVTEFEIEGDSYSVPSIQEKIDSLVKTLGGKCP